MFRNLIREVIVLAVVLLAMPSARTGEETTPLKPDLDNLCRRVWSIDYTDGRKITACKLKVSTEIQGCWCGAGDTRFDEHRNLVACRIERDYTFDDVTIPAPAWTHFYQGGAPQSFSLDGHKEFQGLLLKSGKHDWTQHLYENGLLKNASLAKAQEINGILCAKASMLGTLGGRTDVKFHDNGMLMSCKLAGRIIIDGTSFEKGTRIRFDREGKVLQGDVIPETLSGVSE